jgi:glycosyltransferase involved in cell wall biosynthesis
MNANRNNGRKNIAQTIVAFSKFKEVVKNSKLYLHTAVRDSNIDLAINVKHLGLEMDKDVVFARNYGAHKPYPVEIFNGLYNASDAFITTTYGEGWGLTHLDAMLVGLPVVAPHNTCFPEQLAEGARGYLYPCKELIWADNSGYRPMGRIDDVVSSMLEAHKERVHGDTSRTLKAKEYALSLEWSTIGKQWQSIFAKLKNIPANTTKVLVESL